MKTLQTNYSTEYELELSPSCKLVGTRYITDMKFGSNLSLDYVEHSPDSWYSNSETSIDIDKEKAEDIIHLLKLFYDL